MAQTKSKAMGVMVLCAAFCLFILTSRASGAPPLVQSQNYQVFAFNDLGMHCYDRDFSVFCLLPPFNVIHSQVIYKGLKPQLLNGDRISLTYSAYNYNGSINKTSRGKTNFWQYIRSLFELYQPPDVGILGAKMPGDLNIPQPLTFDPQPWAADPNLKWFSANGIPLTNIDDSLKTNCFSMMEITALEGNQIVSSLPIVVPASSEMNCAACHETYSFVADNPGSASDASPPPRLASLSPDDFSTYQDGQNKKDAQNIRVRENILILHDALSGTSLVAQYKAGTPILCAQCHYSKALDLEGKGPNEVQEKHLYLSRAIHKHHGTAWPTGTGMGGGMGGGMASSGYTVPIPGTGVERCYYCHPGNDTQCLRSTMAVKGMQCQSCHGDILAVAGFTPELALPHSVDRLPKDPNLLTVKLKITGEQRLPWVDMPKCQSCHTGDALNHLGSKIVGTQAYTNPDADTASPILAPKSRFAENNRLYRFSQTHGGVACEACHGSTHAEWPARITNTSDNLTPTQIQGYAAEIAECGACHTGDLSPSLKGPHGIHPVNDPNWGGVAHGATYKQDHAACKACHGLDLRGTVLSRAKTDRTLIKTAIQPAKSIFMPQGTEISCYACHKVVQ